MDPVEWRPCEVATVGCVGAGDAEISTAERDHEEMLAWYYELLDRAKRMNARILACQRNIIEHMMAGEIGLARDKTEQIKLLFSEQVELYRGINVARKSLGWGPEELMPSYWGKP